MPDSERPSENLPIDEAYVRGLESRIQGLEESETRLKRQLKTAYEARLDALRRLRELAVESAARDDRRLPDDLRSEMEEALEDRRTVLEREYSDRRRALERTFSKHLADLAKAGKVAKAKSRRLLVAREREVAFLRRRTDRELEDRRRAAAREIDSMRAEAEWECELYRDETRRAVQSKLASFDNNFNRYLQELNVRKDRLTDASMRVGESFLALDASAIDGLFARYMDGDAASGEDSDAGRTG